MRFYAIFLVAMTILSFSCQNEAPELDTDRMLPRVTSTQDTDLSKYPDLYSLTNGRGVTTQLYDWSNSTTVTYEDIDNMQFIFVPFTNNAQLYVVFATQDGQTRQLPLTFENTANSLIVSSDEAVTTYVFDGNALTDVDIQTNSSFGRTECFTTGFLKCGNKMQDELRALVGDNATFVLEVGCAVFVWCRASVTIACAVGGVANCGLFD
ncbi:MAG: hypothetical protein WBA74_13315 [Cyclobacteriaceae bacterium]